ELAGACHQVPADVRGIMKTFPGDINRVGVHLTNTCAISSSNMADSFEPTSPPPAPEATPPSPPVNNPTVQSTGPPSNVAAALACIPLVGGLIFWFAEKHDSFVRFYAMQSIIFGGAWMIYWVIYNVAN